MIFKKRKKGKKKHTHTTERGATDDLPHPLQTNTSGRDVRLNKKIILFLVTCPEKVGGGVFLLFFYHTQICKKILCE